MTALPSNHDAIASIHERAAQVNTKDGRRNPAVLFTFSSLYAIIITLITRLSGGE